MSIMNDKALKRFLVKINKQDSGCWIWTAGTTSDGYGQFSLGGGPKRAHRVSYEHYVGEIPDGMLILHECDTPLCVAPEHLRVGTYAENTADMYERNRQHDHHFKTKEFCKRGHRIADNYNITSQGKRRCIPCRNLLAREAYRRNNKVEYYREYRASKKTA